MAINSGLNRLYMFSYNSDIQRSKLFSMEFIHYMVNRFESTGDKDVKGSDDQVVRR